MKAFLFAAIFLLQGQAPGQVETGFVTGRLRSVNGAPSPGVRIAVVPVPKPDEKDSAPVLVGIAQTDQSGSYRLEGIPPGRYYVFAGLIDYPSYYPGTSSIDGATAIEVEPGATVSDIDFALARPTAVTVSGRMTLQGPVSVVTLYPVPLRRAGAATLQATVDANGAFVFPRVPPGEYQLTPPRGASAIAVTVADHDVTDLVLETVDCSVGVRVRGRLAGVPSSPVNRISMTGSGTGCTAEGTVDADGSFAFASVRPDSYSVLLTPFPIGWKPASLLVEDRDLEGVTIPLPPTFELSGRVTVEDGSAVPTSPNGAPMRIQLREANGSLALTQAVEPDGSFVARLPKGRYMLLMSAVPRDYSLKAISYGLMYLRRDSPEIEVESAAEIRVVLGVSGRLRPGVRVSGRVIPPAAGALSQPEGVLLVTKSGGRNSVSFEATLGADGSFEFLGIRPGRYDLQTVPDSPVALQEIEVDRADVTGLEFALPVLFKVNGAIEWINDNGSVSTLAPPNVSVQFSRRDRGEGNFRNSLMVWASLAQAGAFQAYLPAGDYRFSITGIPRPLEIKAVAFGEMNLSEMELPIKSSLDPMNLRVTLGTR